MALSPLIFARYALHGSHFQINSNSDKLYSNHLEYHVELTITTASHSESYNNNTCDEVNHIFSAF